MSIPGTDTVLLTPNSTARRMPIMRNPLQSGNTVEVTNWLMSYIADVCHFETYNVWHKV